jgi:hypothetical protein
MTYSVGSVILADDYNQFVGNATTGLNRFWSTGASDYGWGQSTVSNVSVGGTVTATNWATLVNNLANSSSHTGQAITSRTAPVTGNTIAILANVATDISNLMTSRGNAAGTGSQYTAWTGTSSKTTATGSGTTTWTITFTHTITWADANAVRYFFNAGGRIKWETSKSSVGTDADDEWNNLLVTFISPVEQEHKPSTELHTQEQPNRAEQELQPHLQPQLVGSI